MAERRRDAEFTAYVTARESWLRRVAFLLSGDWHRADDLVQTTITKLYVNWSRAGRVENIDGYARTVLVNTYLAEQRSPWGRRVVLGPDGGDQPSDLPDLDAALDLREALAALPPRQRATVVLRYFCDFSVEQTAEALACSPGNVKSQTSRGIDSLRRFLATDPVPTTPDGAHS
ncbi:SigE family RNA polymerase sigma factor [Kitasatospora mediocidica]|uniref:SigE family RNA polymerase sigma factor n=1 Tax=Kitasatospora mediocidica TaxID=58352 RepID=UPI0005678406|nr:SigE family RNA polymerase sigma factor [Kitasatospora mediocidica]